MFEEPFMRNVLASIEEGSETFSLLRASNLTNGILHYFLPVFQLWTCTQCSVAPPLRASSETELFPLLELVGSSDFIG